MREDYLMDMKDLDERFLFPSLVKLVETNWLEVKVLVVTLTTSKNWSIPDRSLFASK